MAKRQSIMFPGFSHQNPIPNASRIGNIVMSSVIGPSNPGTRDIPPTLEAQVTNLFIHLRAAITAAGGTAAAITKSTADTIDPAKSALYLFTEISAGSNSGWIMASPAGLGRQLHDRVRLGKQKMGLPAIEWVKIDHFSIKAWAACRSGPSSEGIPHRATRTIGAG